MKRSIVFVSITTAVLAVCCALAVVVGRSQPEPVLFSGLSECNQDHCLLGIVPGKTSWLSAKGHFPNLEFDSDIEIQFDSNTHIYFVHSLDYSGVNEGGVNFAPGSGPTLGSLVNAYGAPCTVAMNPYMSFVRLHYQYATVSIVLGQNQATINLAPSLKIDGLTLESQAYSCIPQPLSEWSWQGFKHISYYPTR